MPTGPGGGAGLDTLARDTVTRVTRLGTPVSPTGQRPAALLTTGDSLHQAGDVPPLLLAAVAGLVGEVSAGRTVGVAVTGVIYRVTARMFSPARLGTVRWAGPARHWRIDDSRPAVTGQFGEADIVTGVTVAGVAVLLAVVKFAGEKLVTQERTRVLYSDAAKLPTLVSPAASLLLTLPLAASIIRPGGHLRAGELLVHVATPAPYCGAEGAGRAGPQVTLGLTPVRRGGGAAGQEFVTDGSTQRDIISAAGPGSVPLQESLATGTGGHSVRGQRAGGAVSRVTHSLALVIVTVQSEATHLATRELLRTVSGALPVLAGLATMTLSGHPLLTVLTGSDMTCSRAGVTSAREKLAAFPTTEQVSIAPRHPCQGATRAGLPE